MHDKNNAVLDTVVVSTDGASVVKQGAQVFNLTSVFSEEENNNLSTLLAVRYKPREIEAISKEYPAASASELFIIAKMKEFAEDERIASVWRARGGDWKSSTLSYARQLFHENVEIKKHASKSLAKLATEIPVAKHEDVINWLSSRKALDCSSSDERILEVGRIFKNN